MRDEARRIAVEALGVHSEQRVVNAHRSGGHRHAIIAAFSSPISPRIIKAALRKDQFGILASIALPTRPNQLRLRFRYNPALDGFNLAQTIIVPYGLLQFRTRNVGDIGDATFRCMKFIIQVVFPQGKYLMHDHPLINQIGAGILGSLCKRRRL
jgi:hypothetical protein